MWKATVLVVYLCCSGVVRSQQTIARDLTVTVRNFGTTPDVLLETTRITAGHDLSSTPAVNGTSEQQTTTVSSHDGHSENVEHPTTILVDTTVTPTESSKVSSGDQSMPQSTTPSAATSSIQTGTTELTTPASMVRVPVDSTSPRIPVEMTSEAPETTVSSVTLVVVDNSTKGHDESVTSTEGQTDMPTGKTRPAEVTTMIDTTPHRPDTTTIKQEITTVENEVTTVTEVSKSPEEQTLPPTPADGNVVPTQRKREEKQLKLDSEFECLCDSQLSQPVDPAMCPGRRLISELDCPCRKTCARQANEACSPKSPCDVEFGLYCDLDTRTCTGQLAVRVLDVTPTSVRLGWRQVEDPAHQVRVSYSAVYSGTSTPWTEVEATESSSIIRDLRPNTEYFVRVRENIRQEILLVKTTDNPMSSIPRVLVTHRSPASLTIVWDDFKMANSQVSYIVEYRIADGATSQHPDTWRRVQGSSLPMMTLSQLKPHTPYEIRVAVWEDDDMRKPWQMSEVVTAYTADGCVWGNRSYLVGQQFSEGCDLSCVCKGDDTSDCRDRCLPPYYVVGTKRADPTCYEVPSSDDPSCCVTLRCTEEEDSKTTDEQVITVSAGEDTTSTTSGTVPVTEGNTTDVTTENVEVTTVFEMQTSVGNMTETTTATQGPVEVSVDNVTTMSTPVTEHEVQNLTTSVDKVPMTSVEETTDMPTTTQSAVQTEDSAVTKENSTDETVSIEMTTPTVEMKDAISTTEVPMGGSEETTTSPEVEEINTEPPPTEGIIRFSGCEYNNNSYEVGERFEDGCESICVCDGSGHVSCIPRCSVMASAEGNCKEVPDPQDPCCLIMECEVQGNEADLDLAALPVKIEAAEAQNATVVRVRTMLLPVSNETVVMESPLHIWYAEAKNESVGGAIEWQKKTLDVHDLNMTETNYVDIDLDGLSANTAYYVKIGVLRKAGRMPKQGHGDGAPLIFSNTVNVKTFPAVVQTVFRGCFRHNRSYDVGEVFYEGCEHKCVCREGGLVECQERCDVYIDTVGYEGCEWRPSEADSCCIVPYCDLREPMDERLPAGQPEAFCTTDHGEVRAVGEMWEAVPGCQRKICKCELTRNGSTDIRCTGGCPAMPPNAHLPTPDCPRPEMVIPEDRCLCPYVVCTRTPSHPIIPVPMCHFKGQQIEIGKEFYDGCNAVCHCGQDLRVNCATIECPYHFDARHSECLEWDIDPTFIPSPPHCCAPAVCKNDGSCTFQGHLFKNYQPIPAKLLDCGTQCDCVNGNVTCENLCPPIGDVPPLNLPCPPNMVHKGHAPGDSCCLRWMCRAAEKRAYCNYQGARYRPSEQWEVRKGSQRRLCTCHVLPNGRTGVECTEGCPEIPDRFLLPTEQCARPVVVTPDDPVMCPYVVCNNTVSGQELHNVNIVPVNSTTVRVRFSLPVVLVGLIGHSELHFTSDPTRPMNEWHLQKFSLPNRVFNSPNIEYYLEGLRPDTSYFMQIKTVIDALHGGPESELYKLRMPPATTVPPTTTSSTTTTTLPPLMTVDPMTHVEPLDANTVRVAWRAFDTKEKQLIYGVQLKYKKTTQPDGAWITTPMIHRDVTSYVLHNLDPASSYNVDLLFVTPSGMTTRLESVKAAEVRTGDLPKDEYDFQVSLRQNSVGPYSSEMSLEGIPEPVSKYVIVAKVIYRSDTSGGHAHVFKVPKTDSIILEHLKPNKKYKVRLELYLSNGKTLTTNEVEFQTKPAPPEDNVIEPVPSKGKLVEAMASPLREAENKAYFVALIVVAVVAAVAAFGFILLLVLLVKRQASAKAPISRTPSNSAYDNPSYKTYDGEKPDDKTAPQATEP